ncbi:MAG: hypothetical protein NVSMB2_18110 [Chloroflexota bacterium]
MALRPSLRRKPLRPVIVAGLIALTLLSLGEAASGAFRVAVVIEAHDRELSVTVDGHTHVVQSSVGPDWRGIARVSPGPAEREYQIDGSDTTSTGDREVGGFFSGLAGTPLYGVSAWLRDEGSYSRWENVRAVDLETGLQVDPQEPLPPRFRLEAFLRRPEAAARLWLLGTTAGQREGLELDRDRRNARWIVDRDGVQTPLPRWFFPEEPWPFAAEILQLVGRSAAAGLGLVLVSGIGSPLPTPSPRSPRGGGLTTRRGLSTLGGLTGVVLPVWFGAAALGAAWVFGQRPHILDAVAYVTQAHIFSSGALSVPAPPLANAFKGPFALLWNNRLFTQYPPGAAAFYAVGDSIHVAWLVGPLLCTLLIGATAWTARTLFGPVCGLAVLLLAASSPFILFQAGSFLSHPIAGGLLALALASFVRAERSPRDATRWFVLCGGLLGAAFMTREAATLLFALPLTVRLLVRRRWRAILLLVLAGVPFIVLYGAYNTAQTGSPFTLPRSLFDASDHFGFGDGIGFHRRHTLAAGLANTDELLTILQFDLFGWPPLVAFGLIGVPFLLGRARTWDWLAALGASSFVVAYVAYFYHGVALGPRYYFEMLPWLLLLAGRGAQVLWQMARSRLMVGVMGAALAMYAFGFYLPREVARRVNFSAEPSAAMVHLAFVQTSVFGPRVIAPAAPALVLTDDWWLFNTNLVALNCARVEECGVIFALATSTVDQDALVAGYPGRSKWRTRDVAGRIEIAPCCQ